LPDESTAEGFSLVVDPEFSEGLEKLRDVSTILGLFYQDRPAGPSDRPTGPSDRPAGRADLPEGLSHLPNPIGSCIVRTLGVSDNVVRISAIGALDGTPILDIQLFVPGSG
jgi:formylmethanofuran dehydrogenase subunit E